MKWLWIPIGCAALVVPVLLLAGQGRGFDGVVGSIESQYHTRATCIPLMGVVSLVARGATQGGVGDLHVAEFEHFSGPVDGDAMNSIVEKKLGHGWERMVRESNRNGKQLTLIFSRPDGNRMGLFIVDFDGHGLDVVQVSVDPDHLNDTMWLYKHRHRESD